MNITRRYFFFLSFFLVEFNVSPILRDFMHQGKMIKSVQQMRLSSMVALITRWQPN